MKVMYIFDETDPDDRYERKLFDNSNLYRSAINEIDNFCREKMKWCDDITDREYEWLSKIREQTYLDD
jgi:hypothetical protein